VHHYFIGTLALTDDYSAARYEEDALRVLNDEFNRHDHLLLCGGSMLYIDALCHGIDDMPPVDPALRERLRQRLDSEGLPALVQQLQELDPVWHARVDRRNPRRVVHALELCIQTGKPYSTLLGQKRKRPFRVIKIGLYRDREDLYRRIDQRVDQMLADGLVDEARRVYPLRHLNALQTVGYRELFAHFDGQSTLQEAVRLIRHNTRVYARKQQNWFGRDAAIVWFHADQAQAIRRFVADQAQPD
jgi:tRNA dimethylallyltransferase